VKSDVEKAELAQVVAYAVKEEFADIGVVEGKGGALIQEVDSLRVELTICTDQRSADMST
jgi:hypothetical protein